MDRDSSPHSEHERWERRPGSSIAVSEMVTKYQRERAETAEALVQSLEEQLDATRVALDRGAADYVGLLEQLEAQREALRMIAMYATEPTRAGFLPGECALRVLETTGGDGAREGLPPLDSPPVSIPASSPLEKAQAFVRGEVQGKCCDLWPECSHVYEAVNSDTASSYPTLDDRNPASVVGVPWNEQGYAGDSDPASGERVAAGLPSSTSETSGANQSPEDSSPAKRPQEYDVPGAGQAGC